MHIFDVNSLVKMLAGDMSNHYGWVVDVGVDANNNTTYVIQELESKNHYFLLAKDLKLMER